MSSVSNLLVNSALAVYVLAFIVFTMDLAQRSAKGSPEGKTGKWGRLGVAFTILAVLIHLGATITRGLAADRVPWANMFEFTLTSTLLIALVFLLVLTRIKVVYLGTFITGLIAVLLGLTSVGFYVPPVPLQPALQSWWLVFHVIVAALGTAFFAVGFALSALQLFQQNREKNLERKGFVPRLLSSLPTSVKLETSAYQLNIVGFVLWTFTLIAGSIWADAAWGRYWGWDTKEVWTLIIWVVYAGYIHARATRGWRGSPSAWLSIIGFGTVMFNYYAVNIFFKGLHGYSGL